MKLQLVLKDDHGKIVQNTTAVEVDADEMSKTLHNLGQEIHIHCKDDDDNVRKRWLELAITLQNVARAARETKRFKKGDIVRIVNKKSRLCGKVGEILQDANDGTVLVWFTEQSWFTYNDIMTIKRGG